MRIVQDYLSIWEIAHRWHNSDPNITDSLSLPLPVQDSLRVLSRALVMDEFHVLNRNGTQYWNFYDIPEIENFNTSTPRQEISIELEDEYAEFSDRKLRRHYEAVEGLDKTIKDRIYDKDKLESIFLDKREVFKFCTEHDFTPPDFWFSEKDKSQLSNEVQDSEKIEKKLRPVQLNKKLCRAVAQTLWLQTPTLTIADICRSEAIKKYGNGGFYSEKTIREWVSDLDIREGEKRGRPKKEDK